jgi:hypothetical protein
VNLVFSQLGEELKRLLDDILLDDSEHLVLLQGLTRDVEGEVLAINHSLDESEILRNQIFAVVHDEDATNVELDIVCLRRNV